jgi:Family of unknown function (DUF6082)
MNRSRMRASIYPLAFRVGTLILAVSSLALVVASPLVLRLLDHIHGINWVNLSDVGQTYGAISALVTALALGGVAISLIYQARDVRSNREQAARSFHYELLKMEMEDPFYMDITAAPWGHSVGLNDYDSLRRNHFVHMWVSFWEGQYSLGEMPETQVRYTVSSQLFNSAYGRRYWSSTRDAKLTGAAGRKLRFTKIVDEEYMKAIGRSLPVTAAQENNSSGAGRANCQRLSCGESRLLIVAATGGAILGGCLLGRYSRARRHPIC